MVLVFRGNDGVMPAENYFFFAEARPRRFFAKWVSVLSRIIEMVFFFNLRCECGLAGK
jgi:hypothetical protein